MTKIWSIALKDTLIRFRDRNGLILMLAAPLILAGIMGAAFGGMSSDGELSAIQDIPVAVVNLDTGDYGQMMVTLLNSEELSDLLEPVAKKSAVEARALIEQGKLSAAIIIPANFSQVVLAGDETAAIEVLTDPAGSIKPLIVQGIVEQIVEDFNARILAGQVSAEQALTYQQALGASLAQLPGILSNVLNNADTDTPGIQLKKQVLGNKEAGGFNLLAYFAPSMAILFLMFTIFEASRSILDEEREGTLQRLISTPTPFMQILAGKIGGVFLTGVLQLGVLIGASALLFGLSWGKSPLALVLMVVAIVAAAASLGSLITAFSRDAQQASVIGSAVALVFAVLGGNFVYAGSYPDWLQPFSKLTINRWAIDGLTDLSLRGGGLHEVLPEIGVLLALAIIFYALALWRLPHRLVR